MIVFLSKTNTFRQLNYVAKDPLREENLLRIHSSYFFAIK